MLRTMIVAVAVLAAFGIFGAIDFSEALTQEAIEKEQRPMRVVASDSALAHPIPYKAVVCQSGALEKPRCRFYTGEKLK